MKTLLFTVLVSSIMTATSYAGNSSGGGGDAESLKFAMIANRASMIIQDNQTKFPEIPATVFQNAVKKTKIKITNEDLELNGEKKDAINYPAESLIKVNRFAFRSLTTNSMAQIALVVHEFLGILAIDDSNYYISSRIGSLLGKEDAPLFKWSCAASVACEKSWAEYPVGMIRGEGNTSGEAWKETIQMGDDQCSSIDKGVVGYFTGTREGAEFQDVTIATIVNSCVKN